MKTLKSGKYNVKNIGSLITTDETLINWFAEKFPHAVKVQSDNQCILLSKMPKRIKAQDVMKSVLTVK